MSDDEGELPSVRGDDPPVALARDLASRQPRQTITLEPTPRTLALFRDASRRLEDEVGHPLTDDELIATLCAGALRELDRRTRRQPRTAAPTARVLTDPRRASRADPKRRS